MNEHDSSVIQRILGGDINAYSLLVERYKNKAFGLAYSMAGNETDAEEIVHEAFVRAYKSLKSFRADSQFSTFFYRIVYYQGLTRSTIRKAQRDRFEALPSEDVFSNESVSPIDELEQAEFASAVESALNEMPPQYKTMLTFFLVQDLGYQDIVEISGMPLGTVKTQLHRARKLLRERVMRRYRIPETETSELSGMKLKE